VNQWRLGWAKKVVGWTWTIIGLDGRLRFGADCADLESGELRFPTTPETDFDGDDDDFTFEMEETTSGFLSCGNIL